MVLEEIADGLRDGRTHARTGRWTDRRMDRQTDGGNCNIPDAFLKKRGDNCDILLVAKVR